MTPSPPPKKKVCRLDFIKEFRHLISIIIENTSSHKILSALHKFPRSSMRIAGLSSLERL